MRMDRVFFEAALILAGLSAALCGAESFRRLPVKVYVDKMKAAWIGQMAGVGQGGPTEFRAQGKILPPEMVPAWKPEMINQFEQDDIYVEMTFLRTLELHGFDVSIRQAGIDFANSTYPLWHANAAGRDNLRSGIAPPDSGHPEFNKHADDIDYQIEADFSGIIAPGLPNIAIELGEIFGRLMNYGDGLYGGQFVGGMYAEAFFEEDPEKIVRAGLACIPEGSQYAEAIRDVLAWYRENPEDWEKSWTRINQKYHLNPEYRRFSCTGPKSDFNIDAKLNGAYIVMGLLYGRRDPERTIVISTRCGQDSDCNPSNAAGVLFATIGYAKLPPAYTSALNREGKFSHTPYNFPTLVSVCERLARAAVLRSGGRIEKDADGEEVFVIRRRAPKPSKLEQCWEPGPPAGSLFTEEERAKITAGAGVDLREAVGRFAPGWAVKNCGPDMDPGLRAEWNGRKNVLVTHPLNRTTGCVLSRRVDIPAGKEAILTLLVGHHPDGDWDLIIRADGREILRKTVGKATAKGGWLEVAARVAGTGKPTLLEIVNQPTGWSWEAGYFASIDLGIR